ncbi:MAG: carbon-nitrogen hydrolase family protein [Deltaproteobacteria bacterium]|nr:carbon-nitrogen hydrolase family protein [Deltaproteobacteria bacterium]
MKIPPELTPPYALVHPPAHYARVPGVEPRGAHPALSVAALEWSPEFGAIGRSLERLDARLGALAGVDLALLPELCLTGYVSPALRWDLTAFAEDLAGPTSTRLAQLAVKHRLHLAAPLVERCGKRVFNTLLLFGPDGRRLGHWRKRHPWLPERWASPGDLGTPVVELQGVKVTACVCYDVHFISREAGEALDTAELLLFPSCWVEPEPDEDLRAELLPALARRHHLWVLNANWGVSLPRVPGQGRSMAVAPDGAIERRLTLARDPPTEAPALVVQIPGAGARLPR